MQMALIGKPFLGPPTFLTELAYPRPEPTSYLHDIEG